MKILCKEFPFCKYTSPTLLQEGTAFGANFGRTNNVTYKSHGLQSHLKNKYSFDTQTFVKRCNTPLSTFIVCH